MKPSKGDRTRASLKNSARELFGEHGYSSTRISDIAARSSMSSGSFYRYFADKNAVRDELLDDLLADVLAFARESWLPAEPLRSVSGTTEKYFLFYRDNHDLFRLLVEVAQHEPAVRQSWILARGEFYTRIARMLRRAQEEGLVRRSLDSDVAAALLGGMTEHYAYMWFVEGSATDRDIASVVDQVTELWARGAFSLANQTSPDSEADPGAANGVERRGRYVD